MCFMYKKKTYMFIYKKIVSLCKNILFKLKYNSRHQTTTTSFLKLLFLVLIST